MHLAKTGWNKDADILHDMTTCLEGCQSSVRIDSLTLPTLICKRKRSSSVQGTIYHLQFIPNSFYKKKIIQRKIDSLLVTSNETLMQQNTKYNFDFIFNACRNR